MEQDVVWTLIAFGVLAFVIIAVKIFVHSKAQQLEQNRQAQSTNTNSDNESDR